VLTVCAVIQHVTEAARLLRLGTGRCVFLVQSHQNLVCCLDSVYFTDMHVRGINVGGYICSVVTARRTGRVYVESRSAALNEVESTADAPVVGKKRAAEEETPKAAK
jgi:hypothetical protein